MVVFAALRAAGERGRESSAFQATEGMNTKGFQGASVKGRALRWQHHRKGRGARTPNGNAMEL
jgi:hypothetical protein